MGGGVQISTLGDPKKKKSVATHTKDFSGKYATKSPDLEENNSEIVIFKTMGLDRLSTKI